MAAADSPELTAAKRLLDDAKDRGFAFELTVLHTVLSDWASYPAGRRLS